MTHSEGWFLAVWSASGSAPLSMNSDLVVGLRLFNTARVGELEQRQHTYMYMYMYMYTHIQGHGIIDEMGYCMSSPIESPCTYMTLDIGLG